MNRFVLRNTFIKIYIYISLFNKYFYKNKRSKLCFEDCVAVLNVIYLLYGGSKSLYMLSKYISGSLNLTSVVIWVYVLSKCSVLLK